MKVVAYSIKPFEKEYLIKANQKKHDITLISNRLTPETVGFAEGKDAVIVFTNDDVSAPVIQELNKLGVRFIATRSAGTDHIDKQAAALHGIKLASVPAYSPQAIAEHTVALALALNRRLPRADKQSHHFDFRLDDLMGFNLHQKTVGIVGLGNIGRATAAIFKGFGCRIIGYDANTAQELNFVEKVSLQTLYHEADIISLHLPLTPETYYMIDARAIAAMKEGVMLLNTSRGGLMKTVDVVEGVYSGHIGYLGLDVYENEKNLFFDDHEYDRDKDPLLQQLLNHPNVLVTPHQAFLTKEALQQITQQTIKNLDLWQDKKCVGDACACARGCRTATPATSKPQEDNVNNYLL
ncbi:D-lactate dehydrogenase [Mucilaginibacter yixingensis]|uniref:D-lactate dehydrogenase n=1 Tax=Mucilaginibacter yixingensis TaxID=1295612 RepID=A0A2T5JBH5_9SPHI|nr:2-hydroxyacid dehydrogenase [Mucilaginibacter yixingensis]PTQ98215.1 D-lactate dehydrogenase [Mucilaginibacter yixingensis]